MSSTTTITTASTALATATPIIIGRFCVSKQCNRLSYLQYCIFSIPVVTAGVGELVTDGRRVTTELLAVEDGTACVEKGVGAYFTR